ncbi:hypothetical protein JG687_00019065, partial [Phytophthora cactorum]
VTPRSESVEKSKDQIEQKNWKKAYKHVQEVEDKYLQALEDDTVECANVEIVAVDPIIEESDNDSL